MVGIPASRGKPSGQRVYVSCTTLLFQPRLYSTRPLFLQQSTPTQHHSLTVITASSICVCSAPRDRPEALRRAPSSLDRPDQRPRRADNLITAAPACASGSTTAAVVVMDAPFAAFPSAEPVAELSSRDDACALSIDLKRTETHNADPRHAFPRVGNRRLAVTAFLLFMRKSFLAPCLCSRARRPSFWMPCDVCSTLGAALSLYRRVGAFDNRCATSIFIPFLSLQHVPCVTRRLEAGSVSLTP